jgi:hypothetical protein
MKFRYIGEEYSEIFGFKWVTGVVHDVEDAHAVTKLSRMTTLFAAADAFTDPHGGPDWDKAPEFAAEGTEKEIAKRFAPAVQANVTPIRKPRAKKAVG